MQLVDNVIFYGSHTDRVNVYPVVMDAMHAWRYLVMRMAEGQTGSGPSPPPKVCAISKFWGFASNLLASDSSLLCYPNVPSLVPPGWRGGVTAFPRFLSLCARDDVCFQRLKFPGCEGALSLNFVLRCCFVWWSCFPGTVPGITKVVSA